MKVQHCLRIGTFALCFALVSVCSAQSTPATQPQDGTKAGRSGTPASSGPGTAPDSCHNRPSIGTSTSHLRRRTFRQNRRERHCQRLGPSAEQSSPRR